ncbi:MAG: MFS transporter [Candidatus Nealsonbacteria bacterium]|nr:MFS transporter [Candidatus Nealsonbacteria bacterium]
MSIENAYPADRSETAALPAGLGSRSFLGLLGAQFLGVANICTFCWLAVLIAKEIVAPNNAALALSAGLACFVLPFLLLAAPAGYLADRFSKRTVIVACKVGELVVMLLGVGAIVICGLDQTAGLYVMLVVVALIGAQSALLGPSKSASIPEMVRSDRISAANGLLGMTTVAAIVAGTVAGNLLYGLTSPLDRQMGWISAAALIGVATAGLAASLWIAPSRAANAKRTFPVNGPRQTIRDLAALGSDRPLLRAVVGVTIFWSLGVAALLNVDLLAISELGVELQYVGLLLAVGMGMGNVLAGIWSSGRVELGIVSLGAAGIATSAMLLLTVSTGNGVWLLMLGTSAGLYAVPLQAFLQHRSPAESRGSILAAGNFLTCAGMLAAGGVFFLASDAFGVSARAIYLAIGLVTLPGFLYVVWLLPGATTRFLIWLLTHTIYRVRVEGCENLPAEGGALVVANHVSWIDAVLLVLHCPRPIRMVGFAEYVQKWWLRWLTEDFRTISLGTGRKSVVRSIRTVREALREGDLVGIFPEGNITRSGKIEEFQGGFLSMRKGTDTPVVPVYLGGLWGSVFSFERGRFFWKWPKRWPYPVTIRIGRPIAEPVDGEQIRQAVTNLE